MTGYDVALLSACARYGEAHPNPQTGPHNYCRFPFQRFRPDHFTSLSILDYQANQRYLDIGVQNANSDLLGYQFRLDGLEIDRVENLHNPEEFPITPYTDGRATVMGLSLQDSIIRRSSEWRPLVRVYYRGTPDPEVCFGEIVDLVNAEYERINGFFGNPCVLTEPSVTGAPPAKIEVRATTTPQYDRTEQSYDHTAGERPDQPLFDRCTSLARRIVLVPTPARSANGEWKIDRSLAAICLTGAIAGMWKGVGEN